MSIRPTSDGAAPLVEAEIDLTPQADAEAVVEDEEAAAEVDQLVFEEVKAKPLAVSVVVFEGLERTKDHIVARELQQLPSARNLEEIKDALMEAWVALQGLQIFDAVDCIIDEGPRLPVSPGEPETFQGLQLTAVW